MSTSVVPSRRAILAGIAAAPVLGAPAAFAIDGLPDPIHAAIERHRAAVVKWLTLSAFGEGDRDDVSFDMADIPGWSEAGDEQKNAAINLANVVPTTLQGIAALISHIDEINRGKFFANRMNYSEPFMWRELVDDDVVNPHGRAICLSLEAWVLQNVGAALKTMAVRS